MALVECFEYVSDVCESVPAWPGFAALYAEIQRTAARRPATTQRRIPAATWVVIAMAIPVLCWDIWQTQRDVTVRRQTSMQHVQMSTTASAPSVPDHRPRIRPW